MLTTARTNGTEGSDVGGTIPRGVHVQEGAAGTTWRARGGRERDERMGAAQYKRLTNDCAVSTEARKGRERNRNVLSPHAT